MQTAMYWFDAAVSPQAQGEALAALARADLRLGAFEVCAPSCAVIALFAGMNAGLLDRLRESGLPGSRRLLAVNLAKSQIEVDDAWSLLGAGASDVLEWCAEDNCAARVASCLSHWSETDRVLTSAAVRDVAIGRSRAWLSVLRQVVEAALFTRGPILVTGESGTGKELVARLVHDLDPQHREHDLVVVDCTTIVPELAGSEFFGHERGAFTGAVAARDGAFAQADGGVLFLDEIGELPLTLQAQLLRVVQEKTYKRVGGNTWQQASFRLVCATNRDLAAALSRGEFRADLYYRIAGNVFRLPALRERPEDIPLLARHFLKQAHPGEMPLEIGRAVHRWIVDRPYPGNVRELQLLMTRVSQRHVGRGPLTLGDIPDDERAVLRCAPPGDWLTGMEDAIRRALREGVNLRDITNSVKDSVIRLALEDSDRNVSTAAKRLGVTERAIQYRRAAERKASPNEL